MKLNTKQAIKDLLGKDIKAPEGVFTVGTALSNILVEAKEGGKMKMFILAQSCVSKDSIQLDSADLILIKNAVENTSNYNNLVTGQLLQILEDLKEDK
jgi:hypothetical protein